ncbi:acyl-CoA dehydratase activase-related protein [Marinisporobacter balticus]|uniref:Putative nucleotide-binding protein (Sugar kinase/HSP70/actin superfamily) n=1 Tax=Marinisporobacter balticus TaxID=2018667 RepID=A0A4R2L6X6_9FIRM|nr:acyl-CoA dehydratase activase-related protein [Marinisporobacter balticus]TCO74955.1 putative nucleotide-binding protein (sugar kinase/HSP70/actin superfamily) [Marinisporobacter balticus]
MTVNVGIPRALLYYEYYPLWNAFFENLGAKVVLSEKTNKKIFDDGIKNTVDEACIPIKLFHGHVMNIKDEVDYLFIPRIKSIAKDEYICPKFCGLPEMIKHAIKDLPTIISTEINLFKSTKGIKKTVCEVGKYFSDDEKNILSAYERAYYKYRNDKKAMQNKRNTENNKKIMIMGHPYHLYDVYLNMNTLEKFEAKEVDVVTPEMIDIKTINEYAKKFEGNLYWTFARKLIGTTMYLVDRKNVDGIIYISTFGCGVDSVVGDLVEKYIRRKSNIPFMLLTLDEHSGEAGINTRIEAFMDMVKWRDKFENNIPAHG